jgi:hypothetical protein
MRKCLSAECEAFNGNSRPLTQNWKKLAVKGERLLAEQR